MKLKSYLLLILPSILFSMSLDGRSIRIENLTDYQIFFLDKSEKNLEFMNEKSKEIEISKIIPDDSGTIYLELIGPKTITRDDYYNTFSIPFFENVVKLTIKEQQNIISFTEYDQFDSGVYSIQHNANTRICKNASSEDTSILMSFFSWIFSTSE